MSESTCGYGQQCLDLIFHIIRDRLLLSFSSTFTEPPSTIDRADRAVVSYKPLSIVARAIARRQPDSKDVIGRTDGRLEAS